MNRASHAHEMLFLRRCHNVRGKGLPWHSKKHNKKAEAIAAAGGIIYKISRGGTPSRRNKPRAAEETKKESRMELLIKNWRRPHQRTDKESVINYNTQQQTREPCKRLPCFN